MHTTGQEHVRFLHTLAQKLGQSNAPQTAETAKRIAEAAAAFEGMLNSGEILDTLGSKRIARIFRAGTKLQLQLTCGRVNCEVVALGRYELLVKVLNGASIAEVGERVLIPKHSILFIRFLGEEEAANGS